MFDHRISTIRVFESTILTRGKKENGLFGWNRKEKKRARICDRSKGKGNARRWITLNRNVHSIRTLTKKRIVFTSFFCFIYLLFFSPLSHESVSLSSLENPKWWMVGETRMYRQSGEGVSFPGGAWCGGVSQLNGHR